MEHSLAWFHYAYINDKEQHLDEDGMERISSCRDIIWSITKNGARFTGYHYFLRTFTFIDMLFNFETLHRPSAVSILHLILKRLHQKHSDGMLITQIIAAVMVVSRRRSRIMIVDWIFHSHHAPWIFTNCCESFFLLQTNMLSTIQPLSCSPSTSWCSNCLMRQSINHHNFPTCIYHHLLVTSTIWILSPIHLLSHISFFYQSLFDYWYFGNPSRCKYYGRWSSLWTIVY